jgi:hypothetical protein
MLSGTLVYTLATAAGTAAIEVPAAIMNTVAQAISECFIRTHSPFP